MCASLQHVKQLTVPRLEQKMLLEYQQQKWAYLRLVVINPATTQASKGSAVKLTAVKKMVEAANSTAAGFQLQHRSRAYQIRLYNKPFPSASKASLLPSREACCCDLNSSKARMMLIQAGL